MILATAIAFTTNAHGDEVGFPCDGCLVVGEPGKPPAPLVVVLHGDEGGPSRLVGAWANAAKKAGAIVFGPKCPQKEGCSGSYWRWNGEPSWLFTQIEALSAKYAVDPERRYLAGWSGGSTYLTYRMSEWFPEFAAASIAGGGAPEAGAACFAKAGGACAPVHYLMGSGNPLFELAVGARDRIRACGHDLEWNELPGADHQAEWSAYTRRTAEILDWLLAHRNGCTTPLADVAGRHEPAIPPDASSTPASTAMGSRDPAPGAGTEPPRPAAAPPTPTRCSCRTIGGDETPGASSAGSLIALVFLVRRARGATRWFGRRSRARAEPQ